ncbi:MAG TPA: hypothetical protein VHK68_12100, partial [Gemmatimonadales bacterium]|nr:hypothetical protein [Gemmatimonadales bacterium]
MRVILLTQHYPRWAGDGRAAELSSLVRGLIRRGISVRVVAAGERTAEGQIDGVPVRWVRATGRDAAPEHESSSAVAAAPLR